MIVRIALVIIVIGLIVVITKISLRSSEEDMAIFDFSANEIDTVTIQFDLRESPTTITDTSLFPLLVNGLRNAVKTRVDLEGRDLARDLYVTIQLKDSETLTLIWVGPTYIESRSGYQVSASALEPFLEELRKRTLE